MVELPSVQIISMKGASPAPQNGAALIVALVLLAAISIVGVSNMQSSTLGMRMAASAFERERSFAIVDAGLREAEYKLNTQMNIKLENLQSDVCGASSKCFVADCTGGLCFDGEFESSMTEIECVVSPDATVDRVKYWEDPSIWSTSGKHLTTTIRSKEVKYIYEFLCFVPSSAAPFNVANPNDGEPLFRITAYSESEGDRAPIMLQSTVALEM